MSDSATFAAFLAFLAVLVLCFRRVVTPYRRSATYQRSRWRRLALAQGLITTGVPGELTGTWGSVTLVLGAQFVPAKPLHLELRALGLADPCAALAAAHLDPRFDDWHHEVVEGELRARAPLHGSRLGVDDVDHWIVVVGGACSACEGTYRCRAG